MSGSSHDPDPAGTTSGAIYAEISAGDLFDRISILEIKLSRLPHEDARRNVRRELEALQAARERAGVPTSTRLLEAFAALKAVNDRLWDIEDRIRTCETAGDFGPTFVELARSVYRENDRRASLKRRINELTGSRIIEEKSYPDY